MDWDQYLQAAEESSRKAGNMLKKHFDTYREIKFKGAVNLVTNFDEQAQQMIFEHLSNCFPKHDFLAEEDLCEERGSEFRWIIDPLDGTTNFAHRFPIYCTSIALEKNGKIFLGVVYDPMREEMFTAIRGRGSWLNGREITVSSVADLDRSLLSTGFPYDVRESEENNLEHFASFVTKAQAVRRCGSAAMDLCYVACGRFDGFWELKLSSWDVAAGALIAIEAGGLVSDFQGKGFSIFGQEILASNSLIHNQMIKVLQLSKQKRLKN
jgi:myo-inositol-1(or 4)-monophosphatase